MSVCKIIKRAHVGAKAQESTKIVIKDILLPF